MEKNERIGIVGPNGAGKTTLFHLIMGLLTPSSGLIEIFGKARNKAADFIEVRKKIGLLFQDSDDQLFCPTVEEDIAFGPLNLGKTHEETRMIVKDTCQKLRLIGHEKRITHRLSGGEKRLVALAAVMAMHPECYLLDEPTIGLDEKTTNIFVSYLREHADTYIIISHNNNFLRSVTDKIYQLVDGSLNRI